MKNWKKIVGYLLGLGIIVYLFWVFDFDWGKLTQLSMVDFVWLSIISLALLSLNGIILTPQLSLFGFKIPKGEAFFISQFYNLLNYFPLKAGLIGEGIQLHLRYGLSYKKFIIINLVNYGLNFFIYIMVGIVLFLFFPLSQIFPFARPVYFFVFAGLLIISILIYAFMPRYLTVRRGFSFFFEDRQILWQNKVQVLWIFVITSFGFIINASRLFLIFPILGYDIGVPAVLMMSILANLSFLFGLTPGGLGIREGFMGGLTFIVFHDVALGVAVSVIIRFFDFIWTVVVGSYAFHYLNQRNFFQKNVKNQENVQ